MASGIDTKTYQRRPDDYWRDRQQRRIDRELGITGKLRLRVEQIGHTDNLMACYDLLKREGGPAPGPDGVSYADLSRAEVADILRDVSKEIQEGTYRPGATKEVRVPKLEKGKFRTLRLSNLVDRVVGKALSR